MKDCRISRNKRACDQARAFSGNEGGDDMRRISSGMNDTDVQSRLRIQEYKLNKANNQLGSQRRIQELRDDPIAAGHLVRYQSFAGRVKQFEENAQTLTLNMNIDCAPYPLNQKNQQLSMSQCKHFVVARFPLLRGL